MMMSEAAEDRRIDRTRAQGTGYEALDYLLDRGYLAVRAAVSPPLIHPVVPKTGVGSTPHPSCDSPPGDSWGLACRGPLPCRDNEDFFEATRLYGLLNGTPGGQQTTLTKGSPSFWRSSRDATGPTSPSRCSGR